MSETKTFRNITASPIQLNKLALPAIP